MAIAISEDERTIVPAITGDTDSNEIYLSFPAVLEPWKPTILSWTASMIQTFSGYPLDTIKTRMQTYHYPSALTCFKETLHYEGINGLFRGITAPLITSSASKSLSVSTYTYSKPYIAKYQHILYSPLGLNALVSDENILLAINNLPVSVTTGALSGVVITLFSCPFEYIKITSQISQIAGLKQKLENTALKGILSIAREIVKHDGLKGLYTGFRFHIWRDMMSSALFFSTYETFKISLKALTTPDGKIKGLGIPAGNISIVIAGAASGLFSSVMTFPIDTLKSISQHDAIRNLLRVRGGQERLPPKKREIIFPSKRLYRGLGPSLTRSIITTTVFFTCYEFFMAHIS